MRTIADLDAEIENLKAQVTETQRTLARLPPGDVQRQALVGTLGSLERHLARHLKEREELAGKQDPRLPRNW